MVGQTIVYSQALSGLTLGPTNYGKVINIKGFEMLLPIRIN